jgi:phosphoglycolate phosphatase
LRPSIAFDLDGTLIDSKFAIASSVNLVLKRNALPPMEDEFIFSTIGRPIEEVFSLSNCSVESISNLVSQFREELAVNGYRTTYVMPNARIALRKLMRARFQLHIVSNKPAALSRIVLEQLGLLENFKIIVGPKPLAPKPDPSMLQYLADHSESEIIAMVGDTDDDLNCAKRFGTCGLIYRPTNLQIESSSASLADRNSFSDFIDLPDRIFEIKDNQND